MKEVPLLERLDSKVSKVVITLRLNPRVHLKPNGFHKLVRKDTLGVEGQCTVAKRLWTSLLEVRDGDAHRKSLIVRVVGNHADRHLSTQSINLTRRNPVIHTCENLLSHLVWMDVQDLKLGGRIQFTDARGHFVKQHLDRVAVSLEDLHCIFRAGFF